MGRDARAAPYRVAALDGVAAYEGTIRANPVGKREIVVAAFTGNSNQDRRLKPELIANLKAQDPDLLFFSGDQSTTTPITSARGCCSAGSSARSSGIAR